MARITIPDQYRDALGIVAKMPLDAFEEVFSLLRDSADSDAGIASVSRSGKQIAGFDAEVVSKVVEALVSLAVFRSSSNRSAEELAEDVSEQLSSFDTGVSRGIIIDRLKRVLNLQSLTTVSKARQLLQDHQRVLEKVAVLSDIRPVFEGEELSGAVLIHNLKISYREAGQRKEAFFAMDENDLADLLDVVNRAELKSKAMRVFLDRAKARVYGFREGV